jgi:hypothetical protein
MVGLILIKISSLKIAVKLPNIVKIIVLNKAICEIFFIKIYDIINEIIAVKTRHIVAKIKGSR